MSCTTAPTPRDQEAPANDGFVLGRAGRNAAYVRVSPAPRVGPRVANLVLTFAELLAGAVILDAAVKGDSISNVVKGIATSHPLPGSTPAGAAAGAASATTAAPGTYVNPVPGATLSRTDEGVDYTLGPQGFLAPGNSKVINTNAGFFRGGSIVLQLLDGPNAGSQYFVAEGVKPAAGIRNGAIVAAGTKVADAISSPYNGIVGNIEAGWWKGSAPLAQVTGGYHPDGAVTAAGAHWDSFVQALHGVAHPSNTVQIGDLGSLGPGAL